MHDPIRNNFVNVPARIGWPMGCVCGGGCDVLFSPICCSCICSASSVAVFIFMLFIVFIVFILFIWVNPFMFMWFMELMLFICVMAGFIVPLVKV